MAQKHAGGAAATERIKPVTVGVIVLALATVMVGACVVFAVYYLRTAKPVVPPPRVVNAVAATAKLPFPSRIDDFQFVDERLRQFAMQCDAMARKQGAGLTFKNYDDADPNMRRDVIVAQWTGANVKRSIHLTPDANGKIRGLLLAGEHAEPGGPRVAIQWEYGGKVSIVTVPKKDDGRLTRPWSLTNPVLRINTTPRPTDKIALRSTIQASQDSSVATETLEKFLAAPDSLRSESLQRLEQLHETALANLESGEGFGAIDHSNVRSDNPPHPAPRRAGEPLTVDEQKQCMQQIEATLAGRRTFIDDEHQRLHRSALAAFPFFELLSDSGED